MKKWSEKGQKLKWEKTKIVKWKMPKNRKRKNENNEFNEKNKKRERKITKKPFISVHYDFTVCEFFGKETAAEPPG